MTARQTRLIVVLGSVMAVAVGLRTTGVTLRAQTAWESYKSRTYPPSADKHLTDPALIGAIDLHAHSDPDSYPRSWDGFEVAKLAKERGMRGVVLKNHWTETAGLAYLTRKYVTPGEAFMIMREARKRGVQRMIVTHPLLGGNAMTIEQLQEAAKLGAYIELTAGTVSREGPGQAHVFEAIRKVGPAMCFVSSDS